MNSATIMWFTVGPARCYQIGTLVMSSEPSRHFDVRVDKRLREIAISGELDVAAAPVLAAVIERVHHIVGRGDLTIVLDDVVFIDVAGVGAIADASRFQVERGVSLGVIGASSKVRRLFDLAGQGALLVPLQFARIARLRTATADSASSRAKSVADNPPHARFLAVTAEHDPSGDADSQGAFEQLQQLTAEVENLRIALRTSRRIGMAVGIVMNAYRLTDSQAFDVLSRLSQQTNVKLRDLVEDVILTGDVTSSTQQRQASL